MNNEADDLRRYTPAVARNRDAILDVLRGVLPARGVVLEVASGSGEHAIHFAAALTSLTFQPADPDPAALASIDAWVASSGASNVRPALALDATDHPWPAAAVDTVLCINMIHIAPWAATTGLMRSAAAILPLSAPLILYGPFRRGGAHTGCWWPASHRGRVPTSPPTPKAFSAPSSRSSAKSSRARGCTWSPDGWRSRRS